MAVKSEEDNVCLTYDSDDLLGSQTKARKAGATYFMLTRGDCANVIYWVSANDSAPHRTGLLMREAQEPTELKSYMAQVVETRHVRVTYEVLACSEAEAYDKVKDGDTKRETPGLLLEVVSRDIEMINLKAPTQVSAEALETYLLLVDVTMPLKLLKSWAQEWLNTASAWATALHLAANDNDVTVPDCPFYVWPDNATLKAFDVKHANLAKWDCVLINGTGEFRGKLAVHPLPGTPEAMVRRLAYRYFPQILGPDGSKWYVRQAQ